MKDDDPVSFEPLDKLDILKEEMAKTFKGMDKNLEKLESLQSKSPIANAQPRMKSMMDNVTQGMLDIRPHIPQSFTLFHGIANILAAVQAPANAEAARQIKEADRDRIWRQSEARMQRDVAQTDFLNQWKMPPTSFSGASLGATGLGLPQAAQSALQSSARPPGPASAVVTSPYAGVLGGGGSQTGSSGQSELRDILGVLREILDAIKDLKNQKSDEPEEDADESETQENRNPKFGKLRISQGLPESKPGTSPTVPVQSPTRPQQEMPLTSLSTLLNVVKLLA